MTLKSYKKENLLAFLLIFWFIPAYCQPSADLEKFTSKYPGRLFAVENKSLEANIFVKDEKVQYRLIEFKSIMVMADNTAYLADQKEYFNTKFTVEKMEAYTDVPIKNKYKKFEVTNFTKAAEINDGVFYDDQYCYKYVYPNVGKGSRLVSRSISSTSESRLPMVFYFGGYAPVDHASLMVHVPDGVKIKYHLFGYDTTQIKLNVTKKGNINTYEWTASLSKSYDKDAAAPSEEYFTPHILIQVAGYTNSSGYQPQLENLDQYYSYNFSNIDGVNDTLSAAIKNLADSLTQNQPTPREKARAIFSWVQQNIKYVAIEDGDHGIIPRPADLVLKRRYGDCKDKTSIQVAMLRAIGLDASWVWVGSRDLPYKYSEFPTVMVDNHMIACWWDGENAVLLDGTTHTHKMEDVPAFIQGKECLIERGKDHYKLYQIPIAPPEVNKIVDSCIIKIDDGQISGHAYASFNGEEKARAIAHFQDHDTAAYNNIISKLLPKASNKYKVTKTATSSLTNFEKTFRVEYDFQIPDYLTHANENNYVNLNISRFLSDMNLKPDRWMPVEAENTMLREYISVIQIPTGYQAVNLPQPVKFSNPKFSFSQEYQSLDGSIMQKTQIRINFLVVENEEMQQFREMLSKLNRSYLQSITLQKIN